MTYEIDLASAIFVAGIVFWLSGGACWVSEKVRQLKISNDEREAKLKQGKSDDDE